MKKKKHTRRHIPATLTCPLCDSKLRNRELRLYKNILYCDAGAIPLGAVELRLIKALIRSYDGLTTLQFADMVGTTTVNINSRVKQLNIKLRSIGWTMKNVGGRGPGGALYVMKAVKAS